MMNKCYLDGCLLFVLYGVQAQRGALTYAHRMACLWCAQFHQALDSFSGSMLPLENHGHCDTSKQELRQDLFAVNKQIPAKGNEIVYIFDYLNNFGILNKDRQN